MRSFPSAALLALVLPFASRGETAELQRFLYERAEMGLPFRVTLYAADETTARSAADAAFARIAELNRTLTDYDSDSELSQLSRSSGQGKVVPVSRDLWQVIAAAQSLAERTNGAFDMTVGPMVNLWRRARRKLELPSQVAVTEAKQRVGYRHVKLTPGMQAVELLAPEMRLDAGGIAKGYAVDEALSLLRQRGLPRAMVGGGGDMAAGEPPPAEKGWRIEVAAPDVPNAPPPQVVLLRNRAVATSGDIFQRVEIDGVRYSHIVDPRTGIGLTDHSLVTVIAENCLTADSLATAVSVLGPEPGLKLIERTVGAEAHIVRRLREQIEVGKSSNWPGGN